jgi:hypothetical protein
MTEQELETLVLDPAGVVIKTEEPFAPVKDAPDRDQENKQDTGRRPPKEGKCRKCHQDRPLNRLMLCYKCWVEEEIKDREKKEGRHWHEGMAHPDWCQCTGLGAHTDGNGAFKGEN